MTAPTREAVELDITGMTCASCAARIERKLNKVDGVQARVNYATEKATVLIPPELDLTHLIQVVEQTGYGAALPKPDEPPVDHAAQLRGRLIGAIGYGWKLTDQRTAMVTPIHDMLKLLDRKTLKELEPEPVKPAMEKPAVEKPAEKAPPAADKSKSRKRKPDAKKEKIPETRKDSDPNKPAGKYQELLSTPLMAAGFGETALTFLEEER